MKNTKTITLISLIPGIVLVILNIYQGTLFKSTDVVRGFVEDYPALWLTAIGIIIYSTLLYKYIYIINELSHEIIKHVKIPPKPVIVTMFIIVNGIILYVVHIINHSWVTSQLNNNEITWFSYNGTYQYWFSQPLSESFNIAGVFYYFVNLVYFYICLALVILLAYSVIIVIAFGLKMLKTHINYDPTLSLKYKQYARLSTVVVISLMFYYLSLQINDIILEGFETFVLHPNRYLLLGLMVVVLILYTVVTNYVRYFNSFGTNPSSDINTFVKTELAFDLNIIILPFILITVYNILMTTLFEHDSYHFKLIASFFIFIICLLFIYINNSTKKVRLNQIKKLNDENIALNNYMSTVESLYHETRHYKHDINNVLITLEEYIDKENIKDLKKYYYSEIATKTPVTGPLYKLISQLELIEDNSIKAMILNKFGNLIDNGYNIEIEVYDYLPKLNLDSKAFIRMLGILIDNAIEAATETKERHISLSIYHKDKVKDIYSLTIANSYSNSLDLQKISQLNVSTKGKNRGVGLHSLSRLVDGTSNVTIETSADSNWFVQTLQINN